MSKYLKRAYWRKRRQVPRAWSEARYRLAHPLLRSGVPSELLTVEELYSGVLYILERQKIDPLEIEVSVFSETGGQFYGFLRPHCIKFLRGHLKLAVVGGDLLAINCGQGLRREVEVVMP